MQLTCASGSHNSQRVDGEYADNGPTKNMQSSNEYDREDIEEEYTDSN